MSQTKQEIINDKIELDYNRDRAIEDGYICTDCAAECDYYESWVYEGDKGYICDSCYGMENNPIKSWVENYLIKEGDK